MARRERLSIIISIIDSISKETADYGDEARITNVATKANLPYDRLQTYLEDMYKMGLITSDKMPKITPKGREFIKSARQWLDLIDRFGIY